MYSFNMKWTIINYLFVELCLNKQIGPVTRSPEILCYSSINKSLLIYCCYLLNNWTWCLTTYILASWKKNIYMFIFLQTSMKEYIVNLILSTEFDIGNFFYHIQFNQYIIQERKIFSCADIYTYATLHWKAHKYLRWKSNWMTGPR